MCVCVWGEKEREFMKVEWVRTNISKSLGFETTFQVSHGFFVTQVQVGHKVG
nr:hypothetical protein [Oryctes rhinoceros nudivirus]